MTTMAKSAGTPEALRSSSRIEVQEGSQALVTAAEAWLAATTECQREMIGFVSLRLEKDAEITREIMACKNLADVATIHARWMEETLRDYSSEMGKLTTICTRSINGGAGPKG